MLRTTGDEAEDSFQRQETSAAVDDNPQTGLNAEMSRSTEQPMNLDVETAFKITGGFGRFQVFATMAMCLALNGGNYLYYAFAYLTLEQKYECRFDPS